MPAASPKTAREGTNTAQEAPKMAQEGPMTAPRGAQEGDQQIKNLAFCFQEAQGRPNSAQGGPKSPPEAQKRPQANQETPTNIHEASGPQSRHGGSCSQGHWRF